MDRGRLVVASDYRLEIPYVERPGIEVAVPTHDVEWMVIEHEFVEGIVLLDE